MRIEEARWIEAGIRGQVLAERPETACTALNLGSGTRRSREVNKPFIDELTFAPLRAAGYRIVHSDLFPGDGIDLNGDLFDPAFQNQLQALSPKVIMFCNILEHLPAELRCKVPELLTRILAPGGFLFVTVPRSYPYHADPIDTMYRPQPTEVAALFPALEVIDSRIIESDSYGTEFMQGSLWKRARKILRMLFPFVRPKRWLSHTHRFLWLNRRYQHSCLLLRRPP